MQLLLTSVGTAQWVEGSHLPYLSCLEIAGSAAPGVPAPSSHPHRPQAHPSTSPVPVCHALHVALLLAFLILDGSHHASEAYLISAELRGDTEATDCCMQNMW